MTDSSEPSLVELASEILEATPIVKSGSALVLRLMRLDPVSRIRRRLDRVERVNAYLNQRVERLEDALQALTSRAEGEDLAEAVLFAIVRDDETAKWRFYAVLLESLLNKELPDSVAVLIMRGFSSLSVAQLEMLAEIDPEGTTKFVANGLDREGRPDEVFYSLDAALISVAFIKPDINTSTSGNSWTSLGCRAQSLAKKGSDLPPA